MAEEFKLGPEEAVVLRMKNCEIRVYEYKDGHHTFIKSYSLEKK